MCDTQVITFEGTRQNASGQEDIVPAQVGKRVQRKARTAYIRLLRWNEMTRLLCGPRLDANQGGLEQQNSTPSPTVSTEARLSTKRHRSTTSNSRDWRSSAVLKHVPLLRLLRPAWLNIMLSTLTASVPARNRRTVWVNLSDAHPGQQNLRGAVPFYEEVEDVESSEAVVCIAELLKKLSSMPIPKQDGS